MADLTAVGTEAPMADLAYDRALDLVMGLADFERSTHSPGHSGFHLERMRALMERLGNCHLDIPTVHVAGTKGKGSTAAMVTSMLAAQGYRVGLYTSPHLHSAVERIRVGLTPIGRSAFAGLVERLWPAVEDVGRTGGYGAMTTFEMMTAMAFAHFHEIAVDLQVIEVGLGGRLDSTNVVDPEVCAITSISLDHVATLGDTIRKIAHEKAGIIKEGAPVAVAPQPREAMRVFREVAALRQAPLIDVEREISWRGRHADLDGQAFEVSTPGGRYEAWTPLLGDAQLENACTAIGVAEALTARGFAVSRDSVLRGLREVRWPARLEVLSRGGAMVVVDGAHNSYSMRMLVRALPELFRFRRLILIFGALGGHSAGGMAAEMAGLSPVVVATRSRHPRSTPSSTIEEIASKHGLSVAFRSESVAEATRRALEIADEGDLVLGTGSLSVAAEVTEEIRGIAPELYPGIRRPSATV